MVISIVIPIKEISIVIVNMTDDFSNYHNRYVMSRDATSTQV